MFSFVYYDIDKHCHPYTIIIIILLQVISFSFTFRLILIILIFLDAISFTEKEFEGKVRICINNAGVFAEGPDNWKDSININLVIVL